MLSRLNFLIFSCKPGNLHASLYVGLTDNYRHQEICKKGGTPDYGSFLFWDYHLPGHGLADPSLKGSAEAAGAVDPLA